MQSAYTRKQPTFGLISYVGEVFAIDNPLKILTSENEIDAHCGLVVKGTFTTKTNSIKQKLFRKSFIDKLTLLTLKGTIFCMVKPIWQYDQYFDIFIQLTNTCVEIQGTRYGQLNRNYNFKVTSMDI